MKIDGLPEGPANVALRMKGFQNYYATSTIVPGQTFDLSVVLQKASPCCLCNKFFMSPALWYTASAVCLIVAGSSALASTKTADKAKKSDYQVTAAVFGGTGVACLGVGFVFSLTRK